MPKYEVTEAFVDKDTKRRYEKGVGFEGTKTRCNDLKKKGFLGEEIKEEPQQQDAGPEGSGEETPSGDDGETGDGE